MSHTPTVDLTADPATVARQIRKLMIDRAALLEVLQWLDRKGGLGLAVHERITAAIAKATS